MEPLVYPRYMDAYLSHVTEADLVNALRLSALEWEHALISAPRQFENQGYALGKWSLRQLAAHINDGERIFGYRALCIARGESVSLPGFDQNEYAEAAQNSNTDIHLLLSEFRALREANIWLLRSLNPEDLKRIGTANGTPIQAEAIFWALAGHLRHHTRMLKELYIVTE